MPLTPWEKGGSNGLQWVNFMGISFAPSGYFPDSTKISIARQYQLCLFLHLYPWCNSFRKTDPKVSRATNPCLPARVSGSRFAPGMPGIWISLTPASGNHGPQRKLFFPMYNGLMQKNPCLRVDWANFVYDSPTTGKPIHRVIRSVRVTVHHRKDLMHGTANNI